MRKSNFKILALTAALIMPLSSCKETIIYVTPEDTPNDDIKTPIELSVGGVDGAVESSTTRAVITDGTSKTLQPFNINTKIFMVMKSEYDEGNIDFSGAHTTKYNVSRGEVDVTKNDNTNNRSVINFNSMNQRYWDDAHARSSMLSIYAYAQKGQTWNNVKFNETEYYTEDSSKQPYAWTTTEIVPTILNWQVSGETKYAQTQNSVLAQDLLFSNNLANNGEGKDGRLKFNFGSRKFPQLGEANMIFYHAMSKFTINIVEGDGFDNTSTNKDNDFKFKTGTNIALNGFYVKGKFDIKAGEFTTTASDIASISSIYNKGFADGKYTLEALVVPGTNLYESVETKAFNFIIDDNEYKISANALAEAIRKWKDSDESTPNSSFTTLEAGKNYVFTFVVGKTKIEHLTATVAEWENVEAESYTPIIDVNQTYGVADTKAFDKTYTLLRSTTKTGNYTTGSGATMTYADSKFTMAPQLYWPDHKTHYFFRGVYPAVGSTNGPSLVNDTGNKTTTISVTNCAYAAGKSPSDLMIGIPRNSDGTDETCKVDGTGHKASSAQGICATSGNINLNFRYAMSQVEVRLKTTTDDAAVNLTNAKVEIVNGYTNGTIALSDGGATATGSTSNYELHTAPTGDNRDGVATTNIRHDAIVPQNLTNGTTTNLRFKITIYKAGSTTEIDDIYYADIKDINVKVGTADPTTITSWDAGKHYIYTLNLSKTEIKVSATITDWVTATGSTNVWF